MKGADLQPGHEEQRSVGNIPLYVFVFRPQQQVPVLIINVRGLDSSRDGTFKNVER